MKKYLINENQRNKMIKILSVNGIDNKIINTASKMDMDLIKLFYEKIIISNRAENQEALESNLLGIYGNYIAKTYYKKLGYDVKTEVPVYDESGNEITKADLCIKDNNGEVSLCEVKTSLKILSNKKQYSDNDRKEDLLKYKMMGEKLIKQVKKLSMASKNVKVLVFKGCFIDEEIIMALNEMGVQIVVIALEIEELKEYVNELVNNVKLDHERIISKNR